MRRTWDWEYVGEIMPDMLDGFIITLQLTGIAIVIALAVGLLMAVSRRSRVPLLPYVALGVIEFIRGTPLLVQLYFAFYVLPEFGLTIDAFTIGYAVLGIHFGTYTAEVYRAGIDGIQRGQWEASTALNLRPAQTWISIILPQAIPTMIPALGNYLIAMFKEVPLVAAITVLDVLGAGKEHCARDFRCLEPYTIAGVFYLGASIPSSLFVRLMERRLGYARA